MKKKFKRAVAVLSAATMALVFSSSTFAEEQLAETNEPILLRIEEMSDGGRVFVYDASTPSLALNEHYAQLFEEHGLTDFNEGRRDMLIVHEDGTETFLEGIYDTIEISGVQAVHTNPITGGKCNNTYYIRTCGSITSSVFLMSHGLTTGSACAVYTETRNHVDNCTSCGGVIATGTHPCYERHYSSYCKLSRYLHQ